jgi:hypothetical protein
MFTMRSDPLVAPFVCEFRFVMDACYVERRAPLDVPLAQMLANALAALEQLTTLSLKWDERFLPGCMSHAFAAAWPAVGPRLTTLRLWLDVAGAQCLRTLGPCAPHLRELALLLVGDASCAATHDFAWARVVPALVAPAQRTLLTLRIELDLRVYSFPPEAAWADASGYAPLALPLGRMFGALAALPLPRLRSLTVDTPFTDSEEDALVRLVSTHGALRALSLTPSYVEQHERAGAVRRSYGPGYVRCLALARAHAAHLPQHLARLALRLSAENLAPVLELLGALPCALEELWLGPHPLVLADLARVAHALRRSAYSLRVLHTGVRALTPGVLALLAGAFPSLRVLRLGAGWVCADDHTPQVDGERGFADALRGRTFDWPLRELTLGPLCVDRFAPALRAAIPSLELVGTMVTPRAWDERGAVEFSPHQQNWGMCDEGWSD